MRRAVTTVVTSWRQAGPDSRSHAFVAVWAPMAAVGTISRVVTFRLPAWWYRLRPFEASGRCYERIGVRTAKAALRRGPLAVFNPGLHLPAERTPEQMAALEARMCEAEASHTILFGVTLAVSARAAWRGDHRAARWMLLWNLLMNGYPAMLQRYNRALLHQRMDPPGDSQGVPSGR